MQAKQLIECVPNFSEGRDSLIIERILQSVISEGDCEIWDYSSDIYHNRSVFTIAGSPDALENAALRFTQTASEFIDMETHIGVHPCVGAVDVIPFIPLRNASMGDCIALSERTAKRIAAELNLPVYLYANSAVNPAHKRLADIRRGGYSKLQTEIKNVPERKPDFGPAELTSAGAVSVGARDFLIAFNVYLDTKDVKIAENIAKKIRTSSGGFPFLQAIGLPVNGLAQVSMNLLNYRVTSLKTVFEAICCEADKFEIKPKYSELIGMLPKDALRDISPDELLLHDFCESRILENHFK